MNQNDIHELVEKQRAYFYSNETERVIIQKLLYWLKLLNLKCLRVSIWTQNKLS